MTLAAEHQLNEILRKERLAPGIALFEVHTPLIARTVQAGQFVVVRADDYAERIPLTVADRHLENGTITLIVQIIGLSTRKMDQFQVGDTFLDVIGPLGKPTEVRKAGTVGCIGGHTDWITQAQYQTELTHTPGRLWCNPALPTGN